MTHSRRSFILKSSLAVAGLSLLGSRSFASDKLLVAEGGTFTLPPLPYAYNALEPYIDQQTMEIHHTKHHQAYVNNLNKALADLKVNTAGLSAEDILGKVSTYNDAVRNNCGGHYNHTLFWSLMRPAYDTVSNNPTGKLLEAVNAAFGSFEKMKEEFAKAAKDRFGSGWAWLIVQNGKLVITSTPNQDNPLMDIAPVKGNPVLALDVWEHAYYLKYQNKRPDYISAWWNVVNWERAAELFSRAK
ncbi:MAG: superoxide dismutase [Mn] [Bacteroidia bacterium]